MEKHKFQAYLAIDGHEPAQLVLRAALEPGEGYPSNHVKLEGVELDAESCLGDGLNWRVASRVAELCRRSAWFDEPGETGAKGISRSLYEAQALLNDVMSGTCSPESTRVLMLDVIDRIVQAYTILDKEAE